MAAQGLTLSISSSSANVIAGSLPTDLGVGFHGNIRVTIRPPAAGTLYLGGSAVTTAGYPLTSADTPITLTIGAGETLYGVSSAALSVGVLRLNDTT